ncbi:MAG: TorF family putative porin, partial [Kiritimatiellia bacterium]
MKKFALLILAAVAAMPLAASAAEANVYADVMSAYVYRGVVGNDEAVFQPGLDVAGPLGLSYSLWANMNLTDNESAWYPDTLGKWGEVDLGLSWTAPLEGPVSLTVGATYFMYPQDSSEVLADEETGEPLVDADGNVRVS